MFMCTQFLFLLWWSWWLYNVIGNRYTLGAVEGSNGHYVLFYYSCYGGRSRRYRYPRRIRI